MSLSKELAFEILREVKYSQSLNFPMFPIKINKKEIKEPNLMQRNVVREFIKKRTIGNWSGMGTGKTLAAVLCSYAIKAKLTMIVCPNGVKEEWRKTIKSVFPTAKILCNIGDSPIEDNTFYIVNYEQFQQNGVKLAINRLAKKYKVDLLIFDEIHMAKQRNKKVSLRFKVLKYMRKLLEEKNPELHVLGQTGTPCINETLSEPISLLSLITNKDYSDLLKNLTIPNILKVRQELMLNGIRCPSNFDIEVKPKVIEINCDHRHKELLSILKNNTSMTQILEIDQLLIQDKIEFILDSLKHGEKTIIYVHYVKSLVTKLQSVIEKKFKVDIYTGAVDADTRNKIKNEFINGDIDILIASKPIGVGVDGLQDVCYKMIIPILPWTGAEYEQLIYRLIRPGQKNNVEIIIPQAFCKEWSLDKMRWDRILYKQSIGDMLMDGKNIPYLSKETAKKACLEWLDRVLNGKVYSEERKNIIVDDFDDELKIKNNKFSEFNQLNNKINRMHSSKIFEFFSDIKEFKKYHDMYEPFHNMWEVKPREEIASWCKNTKAVIGDFGCGGKCHIGKLLPNNSVYSFDFNSLEGDDVISCDIANIELDDEILDVAIFSLSLMGRNYKDYLREAYGLLKSGGKLYIAEFTKHKLLKTLTPDSRFPNRLSDLEKIGFYKIKEYRKWEITFVKAVKP